MTGLNDSKELKPESLDKDLSKGEEPDSDPPVRFSSENHTHIAASERVVFRSSFGDIELTSASVNVADLVNIVGDLINWYAKNYPKSTREYIG